METAKEFIHENDSSEKEKDQVDRKPAGVETRMFIDSDDDQQLKGDHANVKVRRTRIKGQLSHQGPKELEEDMVEKWLYDWKIGPLQELIREGFKTSKREFKNELEKIVENVMKTTVGNILEEPVKKNCRLAAGRFPKNGPSLAPAVRGTASEEPPGWLGLAEARGVGACAAPTVAQGR